MASFSYFKSIPFLLVMSLLLLFSCEGDTTESSNPTAKPPAVNNQPKQDDESLTTIPTGPRNFDQLVEQLTTEVFDRDYKPITMDPLDQLPRFDEANQRSFHRFQKRSPIPTKMGKLFPRFTLKSYRFATEAAADHNVTAWLNAFDSSADSIQLGDPVEAIKSPPLYCALREESFFILQTACLYEHPTQDSLKASFFTWMEDTGGRLGWEISCEAGKLTYQFQNDL